MKTTGTELWLIGILFRAAWNASPDSDEKDVCLSVCLSVRLSVRPSVRLSNVWIVTKRDKDLSRFYTIRKII